MISQTNPLKGAIAAVVFLFRRQMKDGRDARVRKKHKNIPA
jgi:hypothetical protein